MNLFYIPGASGPILELDPVESKHLSKVLRGREGDEVEATNGKGTRFHCRIKNANTLKCTLEVLRTTEVPFPTPALTIGIAPPKNMERMEWFLEKATEIGVQAIVPVRCAHSERTVIRNERMEKILISSLKQSLQDHLPVLHPMTSFPDALKLFPKAERIIAHSQGARSLYSTLPKGKDAFILIGPEGDFSTEELNAAQTEGFVPAHLGTNRLRTETAALVAVNTFSLSNT